MPLNECSPEGGNLKKALQVPSRGQELTAVRILHLPTLILATAVSWCSSLSGELGCLGLINTHFVACLGRFTISSLGVHVYSIRTASLGVRTGRKWIGRDFCRCHAGAAGACLPAAPTHNRDRYRALALGICSTRGQVPIGPPARACKPPARVGDNVFSRYR